MSQTIFRVHPSINFARVGSSEEYYIAPETAAGELIDKSTGLFGGLPIKVGTESTPIEENDLRDGNNQPKRQAARFRIYAYDTKQTCYPSNDQGREVKIGDQVGGKTIRDIIWTVHLANKKANNFAIYSGKGKGEEGIDAYKNNQTPPIRNPRFGNKLSAENRRKKLVIDAGPRTIASSQTQKKVAFDAKTPCTYVDENGQVKTQENYLISFPSDHFDNLLTPLGCIDTLGQMTVEENTGRLLVVGGYGKASAICKDGKPSSLNDAIDNDGWFDDTSDGPVDAVIVFDDNSISKVVGGWVTTTDPSYAPQTRNVVSVWDDVYSTWVEELGLKPEMYANNAYQTDYKAAFDQDVLPIFQGAFLQAWNTNLPAKAHMGHKAVANIKPSDDPQAKIPNFKALFRDPNKPEEAQEGVKMPLALGDTKKSFLSLTKTQYFLMNQWYEKHAQEKGAALGEGERLDKVVLENCLGGRYSPGIDLTFIVRDVNFYHQDWKGEKNSGPFRVNGKPLDYSQALKGKPFLSTGYIPLRSIPVEPGDLCKFMALPWHTDYNSCAVHTPDPNPAENNTLYWSWPAQRPVQVYPKHTCTYDSDNGKWNLGYQVFSVRGTEGNGSHTDYPQREGRYQCYFDFLQNWEKVGFVIQGTQIPDEHGSNYGADKYLEVSSLYTDDGDNVGVWPTAVIPPKTKGQDRPKRGECGPHKSDCDGK